MTTTDDFSNPIASADDGSDAPAPDADATESAAESAAAPGPEPSPDPVPGDEPDDALVAEVGAAEAVELPGDAEILDVTDLDEEVEVEAEPSPYDRPGRWFVVHTYAGYEN